MHVAGVRFDTRWDVDGDLVAFRLVHGLHHFLEGRGEGTLYSRPYEGVDDHAGLEWLDLGRVTDLLDSHAQAHVPHGFPVGEGLPRGDDLPPPKQQNLHGVSGVGQVTGRDEAVPAVPARAADDGNPRLRPEPAGDGVRNSFSGVLHELEPGDAEVLGVHLHRPHLPRC